MLFHVKQLGFVFHVNPPILFHVKQHVSLNA